jgi:hypothetical protein
VTLLERARDLPNRPVIVDAAARRYSQDQYTMLSYYQPELWVCGDGLLGRQLWRQSGLTRDEHPNRRAV